MGNKLHLKSRFVDIFAEVRVHYDGSVTVREYAWDGTMTKVQGYLSVEGARVVYNDDCWKVVTNDEIWAIVDARRTAVLHSAYKLFIKKERTTKEASQLAHLMDEHDISEDEFYIF